MSEHSNILWTDATWPIVVGCTKVSPGCQHCYAIPNCWRLAHNPNPKVSGPYKGLVEPRLWGKQGRPANAGDLDYIWTGEVHCLEERLDWPLKWRKPRVIFVTSMGDLFHPSVPYPFVNDIFCTMSRTPQHRYLVLTKRVERMAEFVRNNDGMHTWPLPNVYLGVPVCTQAEADKILPVLLSIPAAGHFVSLEPLLEAVDIGFYLQPWWYREPVVPRYEGGPTQAARMRPALGWCITGAETGPSARPAHPYWLRSLRDQCAAAGIPFFLKATDAHHHRELDGVVHDGMPEVLQQP